MYVCMSLHLEGEDAANHGTEGVGQHTKHVVGHVLSGTLGAVLKEKGHLCCTQRAAENDDMVILFSKGTVPPDLVSRAVFRRGCPRDSHFPLPTSHFHSGADPRLGTCLQTYGIPDTACPQSAIDG